MKKQLEFKRQLGVALSIIGIGCVCYFSMHSSKTWILVVGSSALFLAGLSLGEAISHNGTALSIKDVPEGTLWEVRSILSDGVIAVTELDNDKKSVGKLHYVVIGTVPEWLDIGSHVVVQANNSGRKWISVIESNSVHA